MNLSFMDFEYRDFSGGRCVVTEFTMSRACEDHIVLNASPQPGKKGAEAINIAVGQDAAS